MNYRPEIDGLRAIAVLAVVFYHVGLGFPGGYVGVDVFFVISGYLITSLILRDLREGKFSMGDFWERRIRRILPALAACVLSVLIAGYFLLLPADLEALGASAVAQGLLIANIYFWRNTNYFGGDNEEKPLLHTWSLAVEEQFYLVFPILLVLLFRFPRLRHSLVMIALVLVGISSSLPLSIWGVRHQPFATFFLLPTRAWELLLGSLIAALPAMAFLQSRIKRELASGLGMAAILIPIFYYNQATPFPGLAALSPCLGAAITIWANHRADDARLLIPPTCIGGLLSWRPIVFVGLISYSLYLWHWPLVVFVSYWRTQELETWMRWSIVAVSVAIAVASWHWVEKPFRNRGLLRTKLSAYLFCAVSTSILIILSACYFYGGGLPFRLSRESLNQIAFLEEDKASRKAFGKGRNTIDLTLIKKDQVELLGHLGSEIPPSFLILGDSHAQFAAKLFDDLAKKNSISGAIISYQGTPPLSGWDQRYKLASPNPAKLFECAFDYAIRNKIKNVFLIAYWASYQKQGGETKLLNALLDTINRFKKAGIKTFVLLDPPVYDTNVARLAQRGAFFRCGNLQSLEKSMDDHRASQSAIYQLIKTGGVVFLDPSPDMNTGQEGFIISHEGKLLYADSNHLTIFGVEYIWRRLLESEMYKIIH
jgi:peptidoglycan/LPS O-acetylase OafA/YrhL